MTKNKKALFSVIAAAIVLGGAAGVGYYHKENSTVKVQERVQQVCTLEGISRIEFKKEELVTLEKSADIWQNTELPYLEYNNEAVNEWINTLVNMETERIIKNVEDESVYGLDDQSMMITVYDGMNNNQTLHIGSVNQEENVVYVKSDQDDVIYIVPYENGEILLTKPNTFVICKEVFNEEDVQKLAIENGDAAAVEMTYEDAWYLRNYYEMTCVVKQDEMDKLLELIRGLTPVSYVGTYDDLSEYGLAEPKLVLAVNDDTKIAFGKKLNDQVYMRINDEHDVYLAGLDLYDMLQGFKPFDAIEKQLVHLSKDQINQIELSNPQGKYTFVLGKETSEASEDVSTENAEVKQEAELPAALEDAANEVITLEGTLEADVIALLNEKPLDEETAQSWVNKINESVCIEAMLQNPKIEQKQERKAEATIVYELKDGSRIEIELIPYDINYYILRYNGSVEFAVNKEKVTKLFTELSHAEKDK